MAVNNGPLEIRPPPPPPIPPPIPPPLVRSFLLLRKDPLKMNNWTISELGPFQGFLRSKKLERERDRRSELRNGCEEIKVLARSPVAFVSFCDNGAQGIWSKLH